MKTFKIHTSNGHTVEIEADTSVRPKKGSNWRLFLTGKKVVASVNLTQVAVIQELASPDLKPMEEPILPDAIKKPRQER